MDKKIENILSFFGEDSKTYGLDSIFCNRCNRSHNLIEGLDGTPMYWCNNSIFELSIGDVVAFSDGDDN